MSNIPNPFDGDSPQYNSAITPPVTPSHNQGFLMMTRAPHFSNQKRRQSNSPSYGSSPYYDTKFDQERFTPCGPSYGNGEHRNFTPRFSNFSPFRQPFNRKRRSYSYSPRHNDRFYNRQSDWNQSGSGHSGDHGGRPPLSEVPIEKFITQNMIKDPWEFLVMEKPDDASSESSFVDEKDSSSSFIENAEILIDSDRDSEFKGSLSYTKDASEYSDGEISSTHKDDDSFNLITPSTSEKDTGSETNSDG